MPRVAVSKHYTGSLEGRIRTHRALARTLEAAGYGQQEIARRLLAAQARNATEDWVRASGIAAEQGNHNAAKDLLTHARLVEPVQASTGASVTVLIGSAEQVALGQGSLLPGLPMIEGAKVLLEQGAEQPKSEGEGISLANQGEGSLT